MLGTYDIDENGDTTLSDYGGNRIEGGKLVFDKVIKAQTATSASGSATSRPRCLRAGREPERLRATRRWKPPPYLSRRPLRASASSTSSGPRSSGSCSAAFCSSSWSQDPVRTLNNVVDGLSIGTIWALIALGYTLVYGIIELINFAHGEVFMIGSFVSVSLYATLGITESTGVFVLILGLIAVLADLDGRAPASLNVMIERVAYRPLRNAPKLAPLITAIGMSFILQNVGLLWRPSPDSPPDLIRSQQQVLDLGGVTFVRSDFFAWVVTIPLLIALLWFVGQTKYGKAMRATAQDPDAARLMGINVDRTIGLTFLLGGLLAGAAGLIYALYNGTVQFNQGFTAGLIAFTAAVMGGIGNLKGAVVGGLIIGIIQQTVESRVNNGSAWAPVVGVRDPRAGHGLPPAGPVRRGDARRMSATREEQEHPGGTTSAAMTGARFAPVQRALDRISGLMPMWAWVIFWLRRRRALRALRRHVQRRPLRVGHPRRWPT